MNDDTSDQPAYNPEPRIVQGVIGPITSQGLMRKTEAAAPDPRDAKIADLQRQLDENALVLEQYYRLLLEAKDTISCFHSAVDAALDNLKDYKQRNSGGS